VRGRRALALTVLLAVPATAAEADDVLRDRAGKRVEVVEERARGVLVRRDLQGRRLGVMESSAAGFVLRDRKGRRTGTAQDLASAQGGSIFLPRAERGVVRDRGGRRVGTIEPR
jgi:hypothetical protein